MANEKENRDASMRNIDDTPASSRQSSTTFDPPASSRQDSTMSDSSTRNEAVPPGSPRSSAGTPFKNQMSLFDHHLMFNSPTPMVPTVYPRPRSQATEDRESTASGEDDIEKMQAELEELRRWKRQQQEQQQQRGRETLPTQPQFNMQVQQHFPPGPPTVIPNQTRTMQPGWTPRQFPEYGSVDLGQTHGLPGQNPQLYAPRQGHRYGNVIATGNARVVRGNVVDPHNPNRFERQHTYAGGAFTDGARILDGDVTTQDMKGFWNN